MDQGSSPNLPAGSLATNKFHNGSESLLIGKVRGISSLPFDPTPVMSILVKGPTASKACSGSGSRLGTRGRG